APPCVSRFPTRATCSKPAADPNRCSSSRAASVVRTTNKGDMTTILLAVSGAYVMMGVLLLSMGLTSRLAWWIKAVAIVVTSCFFVEAFYASRGLLGWPSGGLLPPKFQLLWSRVVEPDPKISDPGAIYLWVE